MLRQVWTDRRLLEEGGLYPRGWGVCYRDPSTANAVIARIPFNWLIGWWAEFKWVLARGPWPVFGSWRSERFKDLRAAREEAYKRGREDEFQFISRIKEELDNRHRQTEFLGRVGTRT